MTKLMASADEHTRCQTSPRVYRGIRTVVAGNRAQKRAIALAYRAFGPPRPERV